MLQSNVFSKLLLVKDYKIYAILIASMTGIFLLTLIGEKAVAITSDHNLIDQDNDNLMFRQIGNDGPWTLKVYVTNPPFGTDKVKVSIDGPYGYEKYKWTPVDSRTTIVKLDIPSGKVPIGEMFKLCVQTDAIDVLLGSNCEYIQRSSYGDTELSYSLN